MNMNLRFITTDDTQARMRLAEQSWIASKRKKNKTTTTATTKQPKAKCGSSRGKKPVRKEAVYEAGEDQL